MARRPSRDRDWQAAGTAAGLLAVLFPDHRTPETWGVRRKLRLVLCGAARTAWYRLPHDDLRAAVEVAERFADGRASKKELDEARRLVLRRGNTYRHAVGEATRVWPPESTLPGWAAAAHAEAAVALVGDCCERSVTVARIAQRVLISFPRLAAPLPAWKAALVTGWDAVEVGPDPAAAVVRDVFGHPDPPAFDGWKSASVVALAEGIAADGGFDRLPVLADALEDAGCEDGRVLGHCRGPGPHGRGCWVVDSILGK